MTLYRPAHFRVDEVAALFAFMQAHAFATLVSSGEEGLDVSHVPLLPQRDADGSIRLLGHMARANPQWDALETAQHVLAIFQGPHAYVSPTWYASHPAVPTWNYSVVHARGPVRPLDEAGLHDLLEKLSTTYEGERPGAWRMAQQPPEFIARMERVIVGFEMQVVSLEGKFKLSQNRPEDFERVVAALESQGESELATLMRAHAPKSRSRITS
ncbi:MAG TPA: FMN-binding negative transcriptional regulator [Usitatibacter sp.]|nr:FMN-binding negative transcriptional regulator [Usitatibacter sp.]